MFKEYYQNNSGGYYVQDEKVDVNVFIEDGVDDDFLWEYPWCECCGERFYFKGFVETPVFDDDTVVHYKNGDVVHSSNSFASEVR